MHLVIRLHPPSRDVRVESVEQPQIEHEDDAIVRITLAGLCGSDLHSYRGHQEVTRPFIMGHEFIGEVTELGQSFAHCPNGFSVSQNMRPALYNSLKVGDKVVSPFTSSCSECKPCLLGFSSRCQHSRLFGTPSLPGAQAQFIRVPKAGGTLFKFPPDDVSFPPHGDVKGWEGITDGALLRLADVLPTGCFAAIQALTHSNLAPMIHGTPFPPTSTPSFNGEPPTLDDKYRSLNIGVIGLGPVGICAVIALFDYLSKHNSPVHIIAIEPVQSRRATIESIVKKMNIHSTVTPHRLFSATTPDESVSVVNGATDGGGCDAVIEAVGNNGALKLAYDLIRSFGVISSIGVHTNPQFPIPPPSFYEKNVSLCFGRCPVRSMFPHAVSLLLRRKDIFVDVSRGAEVTRTRDDEGQAVTFSDKVVPMSDEEAVKKAYDNFDKGVDGKVLFDPWK